MENEAGPGFAIFGRIIWMGLGPMVLAITTVYIVFQGTGWHTPADYVFFATVGAMVFGRWLEVLGGRPLTSEGAPATEKDFYRYVAGLVVLGLSMWMLANAFGNKGMS
jgi:hypothetical protein